jgi:endoglucanase
MRDEIGVRDTAGCIWLRIGGLRCLSISLALWIGIAAATQSWAADGQDPIREHGSTTASAQESGLFQGKFPAHWDRLARGINISPDQYAKLKRRDFRYLKSLGIQNVRLGLTPYAAHQMKPGERFDPLAPYVQEMKAVIDMAVREGLAVITFWCGDFPLDTKKATADLYAENWKIFTFWIALNYKSSDIFLEMRNEPFMPHPKDWWAIQGQAIKAIHSVRPDFTVVAQANGYDADLPQPWTQNGTLIPLSAYLDKNVVYNIHFYDPLSFTHQGASWVTWAAKLHDVRYPSGGVDLAYMERQFGELADWARKYGTYITVNEFGVIQNARRDDAVNFMADVAVALKRYGFGWDVYSLNTLFYFSSRVDGRTVVPDDLQQALGLGPYLDAPRRPLPVDSPSAPEEPPQ